MSRAAQILLLAMVELPEVIWRKIGSIGRAIVAIAAILTGGMVLLTAAIAILFGAGERTQFSPNSLCWRAQKVWYAPFLDIPVCSWTTTTLPYPLLGVWRKYGFVRDPEPAVDWDLVWYWSRGSPGKDTIVGATLDSKQVNSPEYWEKWTADNPAKAAEFWPSVISHLRARRYLEAYTEMQRYAWGAP